MKTLFKNTLSLIILTLSTNLFSQNYIIRLNSYVDLTITYIYNITINPYNTANITRTSTVAIPSDRLGMQIIGTGYNYDPITKVLNLSSSNNGTQWWGIDNQFDGSFGIINGGVVKATCPCKKGELECEVAMGLDGCLTCEAESCICKGVVTEDVPDTPTEKKCIL